MNNPPSSKKRRYVCSTAAFLWITAIMMVTNSLTKIMAYTSRVGPSLYNNPRHLLSDGRISDKRSALGKIQMALDSRELRFYASFVSSPSPSPVTRATGEKRQEQNTDVFNPLTTAFDVRLPSAREKVTARAQNNHLESGENPSSFSIYSNGVAGLMSSFDSEGKRAFPSSGSAPVQTARFSSFASFTSHFIDFPEDSLRSDSNKNVDRRPPLGRDASAIQIDLTEEEEELFDLLRTVTKEYGMKSTLRVAGGWVRDKILATKEFKQNRVSFDLLETGVMDATKTNDEAMKRITSKFKGEKGGKFHTLK